MTITLTIWTFVGREMSLLFNTQSRFVIALLPWNNRLLISWLQSPSTVISEPKKRKFVTASTFPPEKAVAPHSSTLAWKIPWMAEPGRLQSMGSQRVRHDCATSLSLFTFTFHFHALEKEMATHCTALAWRIPGTGEPGGLPSVGLHRVGHDWSNLAAVAATFPPGIYHELMGPNAVILGFFNI